MRTFLGLCVRRRSSPTSGSPAQLRNASNIASTASDIARIPRWSSGCAKIALVSRSEVFIEPCYRKLSGLGKTYDSRQRAHAKNRGDFGVGLFKSRSALLISQHLHGRLAR